MKPINTSTLCHKPAVDELWMSTRKKWEVLLKQKKMTPIYVFYSILKMLFLFFYVMLSRHRWQKAHSIKN